VSGLIFTKALRVHALHELIFFVYFFGFYSDQPSHNFAAELDSSL
jgi:hypothetical protein